MKFSELIEIVNDYDQAKWLNPNTQAINFGCDCGCGGDSYTPESWDSSIKESNEIINKIKLFCNKNNIEFDMEF